MTHAQYYNFVLDWVLNVKKSFNETIVIGVSGAQGIGKSTLSRKLVSKQELLKFSL